MFFFQEKKSKKTKDNKVDELLGDVSDPRFPSSF